MLFFPLIREKMSLIKTKMNSDFPRECFNQWIFIVPSKVEYPKRKNHSH